MMQDSTAAAPFQAAAEPPPQYAEPEHKLRCPRCDSTNTKFCYYNNYNLSQPRHFCKSCRRYWTKGGALRNVPVGGGTRKSSKRSNSSAPASASGSKRSNPPKPAPLLSELPRSEPISVLCPPLDADQRLLDVTGSFSSLLASNGNSGSLLNSFLSEEGAAVGMPTSSNVSCSSIGGHGLELQSSTGSSGYENMAATLSAENFLGLQVDSECWAGAWPDISIYNPGSNFQ